MVASGSVKDIAPSEAAMGGKSSMAAATSCSVANEDDRDLLGGALEGEAVLPLEAPAGADGEGTGEDWKRAIKAATEPFALEGDVGVAAGVTCGADDEGPWACFDEGGDMVEVVADLEVDRDALEASDSRLSARSTDSSASAWSEDILSSITSCEC
jgi:hypothetical protein